MNKMSIEDLLDCPYWIIDILPKQVPSGSAGQYFTVEKYFRTTLFDQIQLRKLSLILKLCCYRDLTLFLPDTEESVENPPPEMLRETMDGRNVCLLIGDTLITSDPEDLSMTLYNASDELLALIETLAPSEGLYIWQTEAGRTGEGKKDR